MNKKSFYGLLLGLILCIAFLEVSTKRSWTTQLHVQSSHLPYFFMVMDRSVNAEKHMTDAAKKQSDTNNHHCKRGR